MIIDTDDAEGGVGDCLLVSSCMNYKSDTYRIYIDCFRTSDM